MSANPKPMPCPECDTGTMVLRPSRYGLFYGCTNFPECRATHGAHPDGKPLGVPADKVTKRARMAAHQAFDPLWKEAVNLPCYAGADERGRQTITRTARSRAYRWLASELGTEPEQCHIGGFNADTCNKVILLCANMTSAEIRKRTTGKVESEK